MFKDFCENVSEEPVPQLAFYEEVSPSVIRNEILKKTKHTLNRCRCKTVF